MTEYYNNFTDADDFVDCVDRGCEIEFLYAGKHYGIGMGEDSKFYILEVNNYDSEKEYEYAKDILTYPIGNKTIGDILQHMKVIDRSF